MPLSFVAETFLRFLFETVFYFLGYATGWLVVPALSFGFYDVEPLSPPKRNTRRPSTTSTARLPRQISADATTAIGILFWLVLVGLGALFWWLARP